jgi:hypothetical protein
MSALPGGLLQVEVRIWPVVFVTKKCYRLRWLNVLDLEHMLGQVDVRGVIEGSWAVDLATSTPCL